MIPDRAYRASRSSTTPSQSSVLRDTVHYDQPGLHDRNRATRYATNCHATCLGRISIKMRDGYSSSLREMSCKSRLALRLCQRRQSQPGQMVSCSLGHLRNSPCAVLRVLEPWFMKVNTQAPADKETIPKSASTKTRTRKKMGRLMRGSCSV